MLFRVSLSGATLLIMQGVRCTGRYGVRGATAAAFALSVYLRPCEKSPIRMQHFQLYPLSPIRCTPLHNKFAKY